jgi:hypothetical protein
MRLDCRGAAVTFFDVWERVHCLCQGARQDLVDWPLQIHHPGPATGQSVKQTVNVTPSRRTGQDLALAVYTCIHDEQLRMIQQINASLRP